MMIRQLAIFVLFILSPSIVFGGWKQVAQFNRAVLCGYFTDVQHGVIGFGTVGDDKAQISIQRTTNGGTTWSASVVPNGRGVVSSIFMKDSRVGYASIMYSNYSVLVTNDSGKSWQNFFPNDNESATCIYATSKAVIRTLWYATGGSSTNNGASFSQEFYGAREDRGNGIAFIDDLNGVVTMGPDATGFGGGPSRTYFTNNGGVTWTRGGDMRESWGVYGDPTTKTFVSLAEDNQNNPGDVLYRSVDNGRSWQRSNPTLLNNFTFTGHIAGVGSTIYVQTERALNRGMYRSDDLGLTWQSVGGPSNTRDTRFVVLGCRGETVYAFDNSGGVWLTTDGGDGTLVGAPYIGKIESKLVGETVLIPVIFDTLATTISLQEISGAISLNDDLLTPDSLVFPSTQVEGLTTFDTIFQNARGVWQYDIKLKATTTIKGSSTKPLFLVRAHTTLTDSTATGVSLVTVNFTNKGKVTLLGKCSASSTNFDLGQFVLKLQCGDSTLMRALRKESLASIFNVNPNPAHSSFIVTAKMPFASEVKADLVDASGRIIQHRVLQTNQGISEHLFSLDDIPSGLYILSLATVIGTVHHINIVVNH